MIGGVSSNPYGGYGYGNSYENIYGVGKISAAGTIETADVTGKTGAAGLAGNEDAQVKLGRRSSPAECQTCKERKYQDGSNENVSFKSPTHISPNAAAGAVRAHEGEHVANAYSKAAQGNGKVIRASVSIHTSICPECGTSYVSGGTTSTMIKYQNEENPYTQNLKGSDAAAFIGKNFDMAV